MRSPAIAFSSARTDFSRPTNSGTTMCGKTTMSRSGNSGTSPIFAPVSRSSSPLKKAMVFLLPRQALSARS